MSLFVGICIFLIIVALLFLITPLLSRKPLPGTSAPADWSMSAWTPTSSSAVPWTKQKKPRIHRA